MKKVFITTLGCKVNQYESESFKAGFEDAGLTIAGKNEPADIVIINSCTVTGNASAQSRQTIRKMARNNPDAKIIVTGCYAELAAEELAKEKELRMGFCPSGTMRLREFVTDSLERTGSRKGSSGLEEGSRTLRWMSSAKRALMPQPSRKLPRKPIWARVLYISILTTRRKLSSRWLRKLWTI